MTTAQEVELARLLPSLQEGTKTGTLKIWGDGDRVKYIYFKRGIVELLKTRVSKTLLGKALLKRHKLTDDQLTAALERQKAASNSLRLGEILVGMGIVKESDVHQALAYQIAEEIFELFTWPTSNTEFFRGQPPLDIFEPEDLQARVSLSPIQLTREAIRRQNELQDIRRTIPSLKDVYGHTPKASRPENEANPAIAEVLACLNSQRNVEELLDVVRAPDLVALRVLVKLVTDGDAVPMAAQELLALGQELEDRGQFANARDRYLRAEELGHPDFDLPRRIGQIGEALGDVSDACRRYMVYADRCSQAGYPDVAVATLDRVLELDSGLHKARERRAELMAKAARALAESGSPEAPAKLAQAASEYELLLGFLTTAAEQQPILSELVALQPDREDLREQMAMVSLELGDHAEAVIDLQELAMNALSAGDLERAAGILEKILEIDSGDLMTLQSLASTYTKLGDTGKAVRQYRLWVKSLEDSGLAAASKDTLVDIYETIVELDPNDTEARKFLAEAYEEKKHSDKAVGNYTKMVESLRAQGKDEELLETLNKLCDLKPSDFELAMERAALAQKLGRGGEHTGTLRSVAEAAQLQGDTAASKEAWSTLLAAEPGNLEGHLAMAKLEVADKQDEAAGARCAPVFELAMLAGNEDVAYEAVKLLLDAEPDVPAHRERLARIQVLRKREDEAARTLVRAARRARDDENFGLARSWARRALELDATCDDARDLIENLKRVGPTAPAGQGSGPSPYQTGPTVKPSITGGGRKATIEGVTSSQTKRVGNIADRLRNMKLGGPAAPRVSASETRVISKKASSAMNKLRAMKGKGGASSESQGALPSEGTKVSKGPEAPGDAADAAVSKKASSAMDRLRALKSGGASKPPTGAPAKKVSKGPEAPGEAADASVSKKASSAMDRLRALKSGGASKPPTGAPAKKVSKGPEAPGEAADAAVSKKASSAMDRLRALKSGGASKPSAGAETKKVSKGPEAPGAAADAAVSKKASSAMDRLRALKAGGGSKPSAGAETKKVSKGPEAPGEAADAAVSKKASSAMDRLRALKAGGGSKPSAGAETKKVSKGPEAPGEAAEAGVSKKASSAMDRLRALRGGGGAAPKPKADGHTISKGPEAPGEAADAAVSKKASSAMDRLRALKAAKQDS